MGALGPEKSGGRWTIDSRPELEDISHEALIPSGLLSHLTMLRGPCLPPEHPQPKTLTTTTSWMLNWGHACRCSITSLPLPQSVTWPVAIASQPEPSCFGPSISVPLQSMPRVPAVLQDV